MTRLLHILVPLILITTVAAAQTQDQQEELQQTIERQRQEITQLQERVRKLESQLAIKDIQAEVSQLRKLPFLKEVDIEFASKERLEQFIEEQLNIHLPPEREQALERTLAIFQLAPASLQLRTLAAELYSEQMLGAFDPDHHRLLVHEDFAPGKPEGRLVVSHELCHALQDQHFTLNSMGIKNEDDDDQAMAALAVIEGDATLLTMDYMTQYLKFGDWVQMLDDLMKDQQKLLDAPYFVRQSLLFPYTKGAEFVTYVKARWGEDGRDMVFRVPPKSTEQILHPEKYRDEPDPPVQVTLPQLEALLAANWTPLFSNVMGEFSLQILFEHHSLSALGNKVAQGWDGDRLALYHNAANPEQFLMQWDSLWDSEQDATEAAKGFSTLFKQLYPSLKEEQVRENEQWLLGENHWARMLQQENRFYLLFSNAPELKPTFLKK